MAKSPCSFDLGRPVSGGWILPASRGSFQCDEKRPKNQANSSELAHRREWCIKGAEEVTGSLVRAVQIVRTIAGHGADGASMVQLVQGTGLPRSTIHRVAQMLLDAGWLERDKESRFFLGQELFALGVTAAMRHPLERLAAPHLLKLKRAVNQTIYLSIVAGDDAVCIARYEAAVPVQMLVLNVGSRQPLGLGAGGMALLAALPQETVEHVIEVNAHAISARRFRRAGFAQMRSPPAARTDLRPMKDFTSRA